MEPTPEFDVFLSYASEERESVARPLAEFLRELGLKVWFDEFELKIGDNLRRRIDDGLARCRYGVVLLSTTFFRRHFTNHELDGLAQREVEGVKVILPVWVEVDEEAVRGYSPPLAGRIAARWEEGLPIVASKIVAEVRPSLIEEILSKHTASAVPPLLHGGEAVALFRDSVGVYRYNDPPLDEDEVALVASFFQDLTDWSDIWDQTEIGEQVENEYKITQRLREIRDAGWFVFGKKVKGRFDVAGLTKEWPAYIVVLTRGEPHAVLLRNGEVVVERTPHSEPFQEQRSTGRGL